MLGVATARDDDGVAGKVGLAVSRGGVGTSTDTRRDRKRRDPC